MSPGDTDGRRILRPERRGRRAAFTAAFNDYVRRELKFESDLPYEDLTDVSPGISATPRTASRTPPRTSGTR
jgi:hypothetical protein